MGKWENFVENTKNPMIIPIVGPTHIHNNLFLFGPCFGRKVSHNSLGENICFLMIQPPE